VTNGLASRPRRRVSRLSRVFGGRVRRDESGAAAVEFAVIAPVFFFLMFVIAETALVFIAEQVMDNSVFETARLIRTGQVQGSGMSKEDFTDEVCDRASVFIDCSGADFYINVESHPDCPAAEPCGFAALDASPPVDDEGEFEEVTVFDFGEANDIVVVRVYYKWPISTMFSLLATPGMNGKRLIGSFTAFRNEPYTATASAE